MTSTATATTLLSTFTDEVLLQFDQSLDVLTEDHDHEAVWFQQTAENEFVFTLGGEGNVRLVELADQDAEGWWFNAKPTTLSEFKETHDLSDDFECGWEWEQTSPETFKVVTFVKGN